MALHFRFDDDLLHFWVDGDVDFKEGLEILQRALREAGERTEGAPWPVLFDIRASTERRRADELRGIAMVLGQHLGAVADHCAVVVSSPLYYGISRMFGQFAEEYGITMSIFDDVAAAEAWLRDPTAET